jgi:hypothetical protein
MEQSSTSSTGLGGKYWRRLNAGDPVGRPLAEWAYVTPRFPQGISQSAMREATNDTQRETALAWFWVNLEPYSVSGRPYFSLDDPTNEPSSVLNTSALNTMPLNTSPVGSGGLDRGVWAPAPLISEAILDGEFGTVIQQPLLSEIARALPGQWMWRQPNNLIPFNPTELPDDWPTLGLAILSKLELLEAALAELHPAHGEIGHNAPPESSPLTVEDGRRLRAAAEQVRTALAFTQPPADAFQVPASELRHIGLKLGKWALDLVSAFTTEAAKSAGAETGKWVVRAAAASYLTQQLVSLLEKAVALTGHH